MIRIIKVILPLLLAVVVFAAPGQALARKTPAGKADASDLKDADPEVLVEPNDNYRARKIFLFPFDLPGYAMRAVTWPIGAVARTMEAKHVGERIFDLLSNKDKTFWMYPYIEGGPGPGFGGGLGFVDNKLFKSDWQASGRYDIRINMNQYARFFLDKECLFKIFDRDVTFRLESFWSHENDDDYYGIGPTSLQSDHAKFSDDIIRGRIKFDYHITQPFGVGFRVGAWSGTNSSVAKDGYPGVVDVFSRAQLVGLGSRINYIIPEIEMWYDSRDNFTFPNRGGRYSGSAARYQAVKMSNVDYNEYEAKFEHYITLWRPRVVLALHNKWTIKQSTGGSKVPYVLLSELDYTSPLRGFSRGRFRDRSSVLFNVEYRYPIWNVVDGVLFFDTGRVFRKPIDFSFSDFKFDGGAGLRFRFANIALFNFDLGYGGEGVKLIFGIQQML